MKMGGLRPGQFFGPVRRRHPCMKMAVLRPGQFFGPVRRDTIAAAKGIQAQHTLSPIIFPS